MTVLQTGAIRTTGIVELVCPRIWHCVRILHVSAIQFIKLSTNEWETLAQPVWCISQGHWSRSRCQRQQSDATNFGIDCDIKLPNATLTSHGIPRRPYTRRESHIRYITSILFKEFINKVRTSAPLLVLLITAQNIACRLLQFIGCHAESID